MRLSYISYGYSPKPTEMVDVTLDELDSFILKHYPNFSVEQYGERPASDEPVRFIHSDRYKMYEKYNEADPDTRIAVVLFEDGQPSSAKILKEIYDRNSRTP